jgi:hypothetical protein
MANDRNSFAKRQRAVEKKRKADEKRERRATKKQKVDEICEPNESQSLLSPAEHSVLSVFRKHLMSPEKIHCFSCSDLETFKIPLAQLINKELLVAEKDRGGYSLTEVGFAAMEGGE